MEAITNANKDKYLCCYQWYEGDLPLTQIGVATFVAIPDCLLK